MQFAESGNKGVSTKHGDTVRVHVELTSLVSAIALDDTNNRVLIFARGAIVTVAATVVWASAVGGDEGGAEEGGEGDDDCGELHVG